MKFLGLAPNLAYGLLAAVAMSIVLLYLLRGRPRRETVASNVIWRRLASDAKRLHERSRWLLSLALALATALSFALAFTRPEVAALTGTSQRLVLVLDNAPSMATRTADGATRWQHAQARARRIMDGVGVASEFMVLDTMGYADIPHFVPRSEALTALAKLGPALAGTARLPPLPPTGGVLTKVYFLTDGVSDLAPPIGTNIESVFEASDNAGITAFGTRPQPRDPTQYEAAVEVFNGSKTEKRVTVKLSGANNFSTTREVLVPGRNSLTEIFDISSFAGGVLNAEIAMPSDGLDADNKAYSVVMPHGTKRVLLVTAGNRPLESSLKLLPGVTLTTIRPTSYPPPGAFDVYVFDRFAPLEPPGAGALMFGTSANIWSGYPVANEKSPAITHWDDTHPLSASVSWRDVKLMHAGLANLDSKGDTNRALVIAKGAREGAVVTQVSSSPRRIEVGFALQDSNLGLQAGFPVFLARALDWLTIRPEFRRSPLGAIETDLIDARVSDGDGKEMKALRSGAGMVFYAYRPGVYTLRTAERQLQVVVNAFDRPISEVNRSRFATNPPPSSALPPAPRWRVDLAVPLLLVGVSLLILSWLTFSRRWTI